MHMQAGPEPQPQDSGTVSFGQIRTKWRCLAIMLILGKKLNSTYQHKCLKATVKHGGGEVMVWAEVGPSHCFASLK